MKSVRAVIRDVFDLLDRVGGPKLVFARVRLILGGFMAVNVPLGNEQSRDRSRQKQEQRD